jgi:UMP-CMP kinase
MSTPSGDAPKSLPNIVFVLGGPGAGKGTQCANIVEKYGYVHLSAGDLLRAERKNPESKVGQLIEDYIVQGKIVPVEITCQLLENAINAKKEEGKNDFLIDGFPRNQDNLDGWTKQMGEKTNLKFVLFFDCTEEVCQNRLLERGKDSGRSDDNIESIKKRFHTYHDSTMPIIDHFNGLDKVRKIDSTQSKDDVFSEVQKIFT